jgi:hypothetical protein
LKSALGVISCQRDKAASVWHRPQFGGCAALWQFFLNLGRRDLRRSYRGTDHVGWALLALGPRRTTLFLLFG